MTNYLKSLINDRRCEMIKLAQEYGFTAHQTVECSQQLDRLLNQLRYEEQKKY